jgi:peptide/nickel transport system substrate-binding protein
MKMKRFLLFLILCLLLYVLHDQDFYSLLSLQKGRTNQLIYLRQGDCRTLDPARAQDSLSAGIILNIYEGLVKFKPGTTVVEPSLAGDWEVSKDGLKWTFKIRPGVAFHDGTSCNAAAVKFSVDRQLKENTNNTVTYAYLTYGMVKSVEIIDDLTVRFNLKFPYAPFLNNLAMPFSAPVVSPSAVKKYGAGFWRHPVGTGPFILKRWDQGREVVLKANTSYWGKNPAITKIIFRVENEPGRRVRMLLTGKADVVEGASTVDFSELTGKGMQVHRATGMDISYLGFYTDKRPFNDPEVRIAACRSIDREELIKTLFANCATPASGPLPPEIMAFRDGLKQYPYDSKQARRQLAAAGYPDGLKITLLSYTNSRPYNPAGGEKLALALAAQLKKAGFQTQVITYPWEEFKQALSRQEGDAFLYGWTSENCDPDNILYTLFSSAQIAGSLNSTRYHNQKVDTLLITAQRTLDPVLRTRFYHDAQEQLLRDVPAVFINHSLSIIITRPEVRDFVLQPGGLSYLWTVRKTRLRNIQGLK